MQPLPSETDALRARIASGEREALDLGFELVLPKLTAYLHSKGWQKDEADEIGTETYLRLVSACERHRRNPRAQWYEPTSSFAGFVRGYAYYAQKDVGRRRGSPLTLLSGGLEDELVADRNGPDDFLEALAAAEQEGLLPKRTAEILRRHLLLDESMAEIGRELGLGRGSVKRRLVGGAERLRSLMEGSRQASRLGPRPPHP